MKKLFLTFLLFFGIINVALAQRTVTVETVDYMESSARELPMSHSIMTTPFVADLELIPEAGRLEVRKNERGDTVSVVYKRIEYTETEAFKNYVVTTGLLTNIPTFKAIALANAAKRHNADIILGALITVETIQDADGVGKLKITVSGYPARYCNFRIATQDDLERIRTASHSFINDSETVTETPEHKSSFLKENTLIIK